VALCFAVIDSEAIVIKEHSDGTI